MVVLACLLRAGGLAVFGKKHILPSLCCSRESLQVGPPRFLPPGWGDSSDCLPLPPPLCAHETDPGAHGAVAVPLPRGSAWGVPGQERAVPSVASFR